MSDENAPSASSRYPYIPATLSEINDNLYGIIGYAPKFIDDSGWFPERTIDTDFYALTSGFEVVRKKVGEERYAQMMDLAARAKALFLEDPEDNNGKTMEGIALIYEIEAVIKEARRGRVKDKLPDDEGEISGD